MNLVEMIFSLRNAADPERDFLGAPRIALILDESKLLRSIESRVSFSSSLWGVVVAAHGIQNPSVSISLRVMNDDVMEISLCRRREAALVAKCVDECICCGLDEGGVVFEAVLAIFVRLMDAPYCNTDS